MITTMAELNDDLRVKGAMHDLFKKQQFYYPDEIDEEMLNRTFEGRVGPDLLNEFFRRERGKVYRNFKKGDRFGLPTQMSILHQYFDEHRNIEPGYSDFGTMHRISNMDILDHYSMRTAEIERELAEQDAADAERQKAEEAEKAARKERRIREKQEQANKERADSSGEIQILKNTSRIPRLGARTIINAPSTSAPRVGRATGVRIGVSPNPLAPRTSPMVVVLSDTENDHAAPNSSQAGAQPSPVHATPPAGVSADPDVQVLTPVGPTPPARPALSSTDAAQSTEAPSKPTGSDADTDSDARGRPAPSTEKPPAHTTPFSEPVPTANNACGSNAPTTSASTINAPRSRISLGNNDFDVPVLPAPSFDEDHVGPSSTAPTAPAGSASSIAPIPVDPDESDNDEEDPASPALDNVEVVDAPEARAPGVIPAPEAADDDEQEAAEDPLAPVPPAPLVQQQIAVPAPDAVDTDAQDTPEAPERKRARGKESRSDIKRARVAMDSDSEDEEIDPPSTSRPKRTRTRVIPFSSLSNNGPPGKIERRGRKPLPTSTRKAVSDGLEEEEEENRGKKTKKYTEQQRAKLEAEFKKDQYVSKRVRDSLMVRTGLSAKEIKQWFMDRRRKSNKE